MNTKITNKISIFVLVFLTLIIFGATAAFTQTPTLRANGKIAFVSIRDNGNAEIYVMNSDGSGQTRLTNSADAESSPSWSPNGRKLAFLSRNTAGNYVLKLMNADGSNQTVLTPVILDPLPYGGSLLSWSPDGGKIAFASAGEIFAINADGSNLVNLTNNPARETQPSWSPDGTRIAFNRLIYIPPPPGPGGFNPFVHLMNADGSNVQLLANNFNFFDSINAKWSPDGRRLLFLTINTEFGYSLVSLSIDGTDPRFLDDCGYGHEWSPDGNKIVLFHCGDDGSPAIYVMNATGGGFTRIGGEFDYAPDWQPLPTSTLADFDGDGRSDISVFRPSDRVWYLNRSRQGISAAQFGLSTDRVTPADFDGDGKTDIAVFRDGVWYWLGSSNNQFNAVQFGLAEDVPVPADFTGDGRAELAVYRSGNWYTLNLANNQLNAVQFGITTDKPAVGDYDGDNRADYAVYRNGVWYLNQSTQGFAAIQFGILTDKLVPADYDADGKTDIAVYRDGTWYLLGSQAGFTTFQFGLSTDVPAPADYDGDGKTDAAVYRNGVWYLRQSTNGFSAAQFGLATDKPVPSAYLP